MGRFLETGIGKRWEELLSIFLKPDVPVPFIPEKANLEGNVVLVFVLLGAGLVLAVGVGIGEIFVGSESGERVKLMRGLFYLIIITSISKFRKLKPSFMLG